MNFYMINCIRIYLFSQGLLCFIIYSEHLSVIYNNKNYGPLPYILFIAVQNSRITLDRPQCIAICSKFKIAALLLKKLNYLHGIDKYSRVTFIEQRQIIWFLSYLLNCINIVIGSRLFSTVFIEYN